MPNSMKDSQRHEMLLCQLQKYSLFGRMP